MKIERPQRAERPKTEPKIKVQLYVNADLARVMTNSELAALLNTGKYAQSNTDVIQSVIQGNTKVSHEHTIQAIEAREPELKAKMDEVYGPQWGAGFTELERNMCDTIVRNYAKSGNKTMFVQRVTSVKWE